MQKQVYPTENKAQEMAEYRARLIGRPLWIYPTEGGWCLTSSGHALRQPPAAMVSADEYAISRPVTQQCRGIQNPPERVYRVLYHQPSNTFSQMFQGIDPRLLGLLMGEAGNCLIIHLSQAMASVHAMRLINELRRHSDTFVWFSFISMNTMMVTNGPTLNDAKQPHFNADYIHAAMTAPNREVDHD